ncbi:MAG: Crp/Fnr family transcriptional regulator [Bacteroidetes bacterium]|nr:Crp/Fnr family transcriptional regulator [Bacteroidota bacterium]MCL6102807.1 Crp/Fnr family transcriptional regulator [Bacteroidota bacterium]
MYRILLNSSLFRGLTEEELSMLFKKINHQIRHFRSGEMLAQAGEEVGKAILLMEGRLQGEMVDFSGNSLKIEELAPPQMVAAAFLFGPQSRFPVFLSAKTEGKIMVIPKKEFTSMLSLEPRVMVNYISIVSGKAQFLSGKITFLSLKTIKEKIAYYLLQRMKNGGDNTVKIDQTQTNLADFFGVARPSLTRTILELESQGILTWSRESVSVLDPGKLKFILGR